MEEIERRVAREARQMTRSEVIVKAIEGRISWIQAAEILGISARHMRRLKERFETYGYGGLRDGRAGKPRRKRIPTKTIEKICTLKRVKYADYSVRHFWEQVTEKHGIEISYTWTLKVLQTAGLVEKAPARGKYRRRRERRPMVGMLIHLDASTHTWIKDEPMWDLNVALDDADGRILHARFWPEEGLESTFSALRDVVGRHGRFSELYTDRGSHFCRTKRAGQSPAEQQDGQVPRALRALGIRQIYGRSPEARGRSERAFGTIQGRLPQELRHAGITDYEAAQKYLEDVFVPDFNRRFTVKPKERESTFIKLKGVDLDLVLSSQHERIVRNDHTVIFRDLILQLPRIRSRPNYARYPVIVHELPDQILGVSFNARLIAQFDADGGLRWPSPRKRAA